MYPQLLDQARAVSERVDRGPLLTVSAQDMPLPEFARYVANQTGVSIVVEERLDRVRVNVETTEQPVNEVLSHVARRSGVQVTRTGNLYFLGALRKEDKGVLVRRVRRLSDEEVSRACEPFLSEFGGLATFSDGLLVVGDRVEVLERIHELIDEIENAESAVWVIQFYLVSMTEDDAHELGIDTSGTINLATSFAAVSSGDFSSTGVAVGTLESVLTYATANSSSSLVAQPLFYLSDGESARMFRGERIPLENTELRTVGNEQREAISFEFVDTGLNFDVSLREVGPRSARLQLTTSISAVTSTANNGAPIISDERYDSHCLVNSGGVYLVGAIERHDTKTRSTFGFHSGGRRSSQRRLLHVWARCQKVDAAAVTGSSSLVRRLPDQPWYE